MIGRKKKSSEAKVKTEAQPKPEAKPAKPSKPAKPASGGPGFFDTFRSGWNVPSMVLAGGKAIDKGATARGVKPGAGAERKVVRDGAAAQPVTRPELAKQRDRLARQFAELQWDLGGVAYEMASRDHFRMEILQKQAARLKEVDAQLGQVERVLQLDAEGAAGTCPNCGSLQARGAVFCWQCGKQLAPEAKKDEAKKDEPKAKPDAKQPTTAEQAGEKESAGKTGSS